jgi:branched-chain amino acid aminotransferase
MSHPGYAMDNIDWKRFPFGYSKTDYNVRCYYRNGKWGELEISSSELIELHIASTCLHYGQEVFEGLKAYRRKDGKIQLFRWQENAQRLINSANGIKMQPVPVELFREAIFKAVTLNGKHVPPYGYGATLYVRPFILGCGAEVGVKPSKEYVFLVFVTPVGPYFPKGFKPVDVVITRKYDRSAPLGTGHLKVGGNYAASMASLDEAHKFGFATSLYLDPKEKKYIDECGPANFFGIKNNTYITPKSTSILPSITNKSLMELALSLGMKVEQRPVPLEELPSFEEVGQCGTAAVISPVNKIVDLENNKIFEFCKDEEPGPISRKLYEHLSGIQFGDNQDSFGWTEIVC